MPFAALLRTPLIALLVKNRNFGTFTNDIQDPRSRRQRIGF